MEKGRERGKGNVRQWGELRKQMLKIGYGCFNFPFQNIKLILTLMEIQCTQFVAVVICWKNLKVEDALIQRSVMTMSFALNYSQTV